MNRTHAYEPPGTPPGTRDSRALLGVYLNDHLAGATAGTDLARRMARTQPDRADGGDLGRLAAEIAEDRGALLEIMQVLDVPVRQYKVAAGWAGEKVGRLKANRRLLRRSPLSTLLELEALRLGVEGKLCGWVLLREVAEDEPRLDWDLLGRLIERARRQAETLEELRVRQAAALFRPRHKAAAR